MTTIDSVQGYLNESKMQIAGAKEFVSGFKERLEREIQTAIQQMGAATDELHDGIEKLAGIGTDSTAFEQAKQAVTEASEEAEAALEEVREHVVDALLTKLESVTEHLDEAQMTAASAGMVTGGGY